MITTSEAIIERAKRLRPDWKLAVSASGGAIGVWSDTLGRYYMVCARYIGKDNDWYDVPQEFLVNGEPPVKDWVPVS